MGRVHYWVCRSILLLDRIPRYGRLYKVNMTVLRAGGDWLKCLIPEWRYMKRGYWGMNLLNRFGWLDLFIMESEYRHALKESHESGRSDPEPG